MWNHALRPNDLFHRLAGIRRDLAADEIFVFPAAHHWLGEINRIRYHRHEGQAIRMTDEMLDDGGAVAPRNAVAANPAFFEVRRVDRQNVAVPFAGREAHRRVQCVVRRVRTAIHPDRSLGAPGEVMNVDRDELLRVAIALFRDPKAGETWSVIGWVNAALVLGKRD